MRGVRQSQQCSGATWFGLASVISISATCIIIALYQTLYFLSTMEGLWVVGFSEVLTSKLQGSPQRVDWLIGKERQIGNARSNWRKWLMRIEERVIGLDLDTTGALPWRLYTQTDGHSRAGWWCWGGGSTRDSAFRNLTMSLVNIFFSSFMVYPHFFFNSKLLLYDFSNHPLFWGELRCGVWFWINS